MGYRDADVDAPLPADWDMSYAADSPCPCGATAPKWDRYTRLFYQVPCEGAAGGSRLSWQCQMSHMHDEFAAGRDPVGKGGTPFRVSASEGWTQLGTHTENAEEWRKSGKDVQRTSRS